jgi:hypothetical protein
MDPIEREVRFVQGSGRERTGFALWLARERITRMRRSGKPGEWTQDDVIARVRETRGYSMSHATYAQIESDARPPTKEQYDHLTGFFGSVPPEEESEAERTDTAVAAAIRELTAEVRELRLEQRQSVAFLTDLLALVAHTAGAEEALSQIAGASPARTPATAE